MFALTCSNVAYELEKNLPNTVGYTSEPLRCLIHAASTTVNYKSIGGSWVELSLTCIINVKKLTYGGRNLGNQPNCPKRLWPI